MTRKERRAQAAMNRHKKTPVVMFGLNRGYVSPRAYGARLADTPIPTAPKGGGGRLVQAK